MKEEVFLKIRGILPFLSVAFLNAFVDLGHKIIIQNTIYKSYEGSTQLFLTSIVNALILLPFILVLSPSGFLADKFPKNLIMKFSALFSVFLTILICVSYYLGAFWFAFFLTFLMGIQSAIYSPAKYGFIKELVGNKLLAMGNGSLNATSIVAILLGMALFSLGFEYFYDINSIQADTILTDIAPLGFVLIFFALCEFLLTFKLPKLRQVNKELSFNKKDYIKAKLFISNIKLIFKDKVIWLCVIGIAMFSSVSQLYLVSFPVFTKNVLLEENTFFVQISMAFAGLGVIVGSIIAGRFSKNYIELGLIPLGALGVLIMSFLMPYFSSFYIYSCIFFIFGVCGAFFIVPLNALIQFYAKENELGKILAANNFMQNLAMILLLGVGLLFSYFNLSALHLFYLISLLCLFGTIYVVFKLPFSLVRILVNIAFFQRYRLLVEGFENIPQKGGALLLGNHISFIDWAIIQMAIPRRVYFVMERSLYSKWYIKIFLDKFGVIPISNTGSKESFRLIAFHIKQGHLVCLFPEGVISRHGQLNEFKSGFEHVCENLEEKDGFILPFYIRGLWGSSFSRKDEEFSVSNKTLSKRNIAIAFGNSLPIHTKKDIVKAKVFELSFMAWKSQCEAMHTIARAWINSAKKNLSKIALIDPIAKAITYRKMLGLSLMLSNLIKKNTQKFNIVLKRGSYAPKEECVGILLPASFASTLLNLSVLLANKVVVNLNFTSNTLNLAIKDANISQIYTSRLFLEKLQDKNITLNFEDGVNLVYMEDIFEDFKRQKGKVLMYLGLVSILPSFLLKMIFSPSKNNLSIAAILFSSGSEGTPKGVMLNNRNILSNIAQISDVFGIKNNDVILSSLPPFHAFGLTVTTFLPLLENIRSVTLPDPTDSMAIAKAVVKNKISIMCATSTFLGIYARNKKLESIMFESLRIIVSGAEKLKDEIRTAFEMKFKKSILEGYGATETTPVASVNLPNKFDPDFWILHRASKEKSVGMALPGTAIRIVEPETYESLSANKDGLILIGGHQVMVGYLNNKEKTDDFIKEIDGIRWYNTCDKGRLDEDGFLYIVDRYSRFAKIGGEMISLTHLEEELAKIFNTDIVKFCATSLEDEKKGESIVLLIECEDEHFKGICDTIRSANLPAILKPTFYFKVESIPVLGSGKTDFKGVKELALRAKNEKNEN
ncbi:MULTISPECIES: acyl-[ACP]--phospholipid O-acyltransferase [unclassified Campylobacter]|uniref:acyl-[ACP]--phospholipid O-acyltransferase n=1 Tax=unclassified Campylobacter TaxID=2593542 RepID=UPI001237A393|nr:MULTISPECIES: acyl-[ACP]--phospholipid O-acyltransferase [unclassified Campylobacter]KAA6228424.1 acyl-[ACP]--phospholipid O-acyltransferase [Campylobacter sp. LR185c]KAA6228910.1 acyl-[ACP]--phospholipid O-acyltransferase [Campylobacter sp. LR196d]KAA6229397.1 acyl-[ACP]--phospholipid O-acyltransferase [Campylobacter sp. LR286c]KAA6234075.1 acyl-[ACP]--phospholipid O-acyltransferase [Campylobacter sp. LR291e]KAA8603726.1 acyl-[ACP]--phospholipid O-acyltransferase [Campylobacter sp. LR185c]